MQECNFIRRGKMKTINNVFLYTSNYSSPLGTITIVSDAMNLLGLYFKDKQAFQCNFSMELKDDLQILVDTKKWLDKYFAKEKPTIFELPLLPIGTSFRKLVWEYLCKIPYGNLTTYGDIARDIAKLLNKPKMSSQAVGNAISNNPISIIVPCHRVIGSNHTLKGYSAGVDIKKQLLILEGHDISNFK